MQNDRLYGDFRASIWADISKGHRVGWRVLSTSYLWEIERHPTLLHGLDLGDTPITEVQKDLAIVELLPGHEITNDILAVARQHTLYCCVLMWDVTIWFPTGFRGTLWKHLPPLEKPYDYERLVFKRDQAC